jgi:hypothetical protein
MANQQHVAAVLTKVGNCYGSELGWVSVGVAVVTGPKVVLGREFNATMDAGRARELATKLILAADQAELQARTYGHMPRRGEYDRIAMGC